MHTAGWRSPGARTNLTFGAAELDQLIATLTTARRQAPGTSRSSPGPPQGDELRGIAAGRPDLLAELAGILPGCYEGHLDEARMRAPASFCVAAGADPDLIPQRVAEGRHRGDRGQATLQQSGPAFTPAPASAPAG